MFWIVLYVFGINFNLFDHFACCLLTSYVFDHETTHMPLVSFISFYQSIQPLG